jgi:hypothetical protein
LDQSIRSRITAPTSTENATDTLFLLSRAISREEDFLHPFERRFGDAGIEKAGEHSFPNGLQSHRLSVNPAGGCWIGEELTAHALEKDMGTHGSRPKISDDNKVQSALIVQEKVSVDVAFDRKKPS